MSSIEVGDIVRHTGWPDLTLIRVDEIRGDRFTGEVVYGTGPNVPNIALLPIGARSLPKGYQGDFFRVKLSRKATVDEVIYAGLLPAPEPRPEPRPHADLIKAWADGAQIEMFCELSGRWVFITLPLWNPGAQYRIRQAQPKGPTREQLLKSGEASKRKYLKRKAEFEEHKARLQRMMAALDEQYAQKKIRREALLRNT